MNSASPAHFIHGLSACTLLLFTGPKQAHAQSMDEHFEKIRTNEAKLTAFVSQMPKGGDLHNHYSGSVYAESYVDWVVAKNYWINTNTLEVQPARPSGDKAWTRFSALAADGELAGYVEDLLQKWSVKDYSVTMEPHELHFFQTFPLFGVASGLNYDQGLLELKERAIAENVSYIETMYRSIWSSVKHPDLLADSMAMENAQAAQDAAALFVVLDSLFPRIQRQNIRATALKFNRQLDSLHKVLGLEGPDFTMRYQNYVSRIKGPVSVFTDLVVAFESASLDSLIVGVNIVAPEDNATSMHDYWLHMQMFAYCHRKYPDVPYAMHAGELALGYVKPEELMWHITAAVDIAGASRIGHGVDIPYERDNSALMARMKERNIAVEINLSSNEFILGVKDGQHPILLYRDHQVPMVISTDDAGVLRSSLTRQFVLLATRYKELKYSDIKKLIFNSIDHSFMGEAKKTSVRMDLEQRFLRFESTYLNVAGMH